MSKCSFFESDLWHRRVESYVGREWDLEAYLRKMGDTDVQGRIEKISSVIDVEPSELAVEPIGNTVEGFESQTPVSENPDLDISLSRAAAEWMEQQEDIQCPHDAVSGTDYCCFHLGPERYDEADIDSKQVNERFIEEISTDGGQEKMFAGAHFQNLRVSGESFKSEDNKPLDLRLIKVENKVDWSNTDFEMPVEAQGAVFCSDPDEQDSETGTAPNRYVSLDAAADFSQAQFQDKADFKHTSFESTTSFNGAKFEDVGMFNYAKFKDDMEVWATFEGKADFSKANVEGNAHVRGEYQTAAIFNYTTFKKDVILWNSHFESKVEMLAASIGGNLDCEHATFDGMVRIIETEVRGKDGAQNQIQDGITFDGAEFTDRIELSRLQVPEAIVSMRNAFLSSGIIDLGENPTYYDMTDASIGSVYINGVKDAPTDLFSYIRISRTDFDGFDFGAHSRHLKPDWKIDRLVEDWPTNNKDRETDDLQRYESLEESYLRAKSGATKSGHNKAASEFFVHEMKCRRRQHAIIAKRRLTDVLLREPDSAVEYVSTPLAGISRSLIDIATRLSPRRNVSGSREKTPFWKAGYRWMSNSVLSLVSGYGERPKRPVLFSVATILIFAVFYWLADVSPTSEGVSGYLLLSTQSFITFILGSAPVETEFFPQLLSSIEGFMGAFLIAVFVFTLTRSIHR